MYFEKFIYTYITTEQERSNFNNRINYFIANVIYSIQEIIMARNSYDGYHRLQAQKKQIVDNNDRGHVKSFIKKSIRTGNEIKFGEVTTLPLNQIQYFEENNRRKYKSHVNTMVEKIEEYGFLGVIIVFQTEQTKAGLPIYRPAEGNHRTEALKLIFGDSSTIPVPVLILPYDPETEDFSLKDTERALEVIISLNKDNKAWSLKDYIEGWAKTKRTIFVRLRDAINDNANKYPNLTPSLTSYIFTQGKTPAYTKLIESGDLEVSAFNKVYVNLMLETVRYWTNKYGTKKWEIHPTFLSNFIVRTYSRILGKNLKGDVIVKSTMETQVDNKVYKSNDVYNHFEEWLSFAEQKIDGMLLPINNVIEFRKLTRKKDITKHSSLFLPTASDDFKNLFDKWYSDYCKINPLQKSKFHKFEA